jgi:hypothetical protein
MGVANVPAAAGGGIKSVQRGLAAGAGNVTITAVNIAKSFVTVFGTTSAGTVAATGAVGAQNGNITASNTSGFGMGSGGPVPIPLGQGQVSYNIALNYNTTALTANASNITGGSNNLVSAIAQGYLADSTTLTVSHACRYEVVEFA